MTTIRSVSSDELWDSKAVAAYLKITPTTVRAYLARGQMPAPDYRLGGSPVWRAETIIEWHKRRPSQRKG